MLRLPEIGSHAAYQQLLSQHISNKRFKRFKKKMRKLATKLQSLDLSPVDDIMRPFLLREKSSRMAAFLPLCCVPTSFPYGSNQLHSLAGPNAFTQMNTLQYCLASLLDIHQLMLLFTTFSTACGRDLTISRLINVTVKANHQKVNLLATSLQILTKITLPPSLSISMSIRPAAS